MLHGLQVVPVTIPQASTVKDSYASVLLQAFWDESPSRQAAQQPLDTQHCVHLWEQSW